MTYKSIISPKMRAVSTYMVESFVGMNHCLTETGKNIILEVPKSDCEEVRKALKARFSDVALIKNAYPLIEDLHDFILIKPIISESPLLHEDGIAVPELEKVLVDRSSDKEFAFLSDDAIQREFQRAFEIYQINTSRLMRYAARKGKKEEILNRLDRINLQRVNTVHAIQELFISEPIERAWLFGSFARMEEKADSDIDILVDLDKTVSIGLFQFAGMINTLEDKLNKRVDMVANGTVKPFALNSINRDKILFYERPRA